MSSSDDNFSLLRRKSVLQTKYRPLFLKKQTKYRPCFPKIQTKIQMCQSKEDKGKIKCTISNMVVPRCRTVVESSPNYPSFLNLHKRENSLHSIWIELWLNIDWAGQKYWLFHKIQTNYRPFLTNFLKKSVLKTKINYTDRIVITALAFLCYCLFKKKLHLM